MSQLYNIQHQFWNSLRSLQADSNCAQLFSPGGKLSQQERLNIYRSTMRTAHTNALAQTYKCCEKILGEKYFKIISSEYFYQHPAINQNMNLYGHSFPKFLKKWAQNHTELLDYQYLSDLAMLELAYEKSYYAKEDPLFDFISLATLNDGDHQKLCFKLSASLFILKSSYPIHEIWLANQEQEHLQEINAIQEPQYLCIIREDLKPIIHEIDQTYWMTMNKIQNHTALAEMEDFSSQEKFGIPFKNIIPDLIQRKWICGYYLVAD